jgi:hypothetical protein
VGKPTVQKAEHQDTMEMNDVNHDNLNEMVQ